MSTATGNGMGRPSDARAQARRNSLLLAASQAIVGSVGPISISMGGLAGSYLLGADKSMATAPVTGFTAGVAIGAVIAAAVTRRLGRRAGFMVGTLFPIAGGALATAALFAGSFWLLVAALLLAGFGNSFVQQYRFAAADAAPPAFKPQAISLVLIGGVFAAIIGPQTVIHTRTLFAPVMFAGAFAAMIPLALVGAFVLSFLRIPEKHELHEGESDAPPRPLAEIVTQRRFVTALVCATASYALMTFMMTAAPLAMVAHGLSANLATWGIQWHVMAMFAPSFFTGRLIARFGKHRIVATGLAILLCCAVVAHLGFALWNFWAALVLLGLGWNFGFIGATSMVASCYHPSEKNKAQGFNDAILFSCVALSSLASGQVLNDFGWNTLTLIFWPVVLICLLLLAFDHLRGRGEAQAA
ncbi:MFS transporter [Solirhodobacter olei]|uniref:MFS transporter n=1 Tax=Solirhodobacter olei TaxID=2493082 RepID=UPI001F4E7A36|nr:MFS transporter [Solirhodobacter olei]